MGQGQCSVDPASRLGSTLALSTGPVQSPETSPPRRWWTRTLTFLYWQVRLPAFAVRYRARRGGVHDASGAARAGRGPARRGGRPAGLKGSAILAGGSIFIATERLRWTSFRTVEIPEGVTPEPALPYRSNEVPIAEVTPTPSAAVCRIDGSLTRSPFQAN